MTKKLNGLTDTRRKVIETVDEIDRRFQKEMGKNFDEFVAEYPNFSLGSEFRTMVKNIYRPEEGADISGAQGDQLFEEVDERVKKL